MSIALNLLTYAAQLGAVALLALGAGIIIVTVAAHASRILAALLGREGGL